MEEGYEVVKELGAGNLGVARLVRDKSSKELVAVKYIERGKKMDGNVQREIINHWPLWHPNIIRFKESAQAKNRPEEITSFTSHVREFSRHCVQTDLLSPSIPCRGPHRPSDLVRRAM